MQYPSEITILTFGISLLNNKGIFKAESIFKTYEEEYCYVL
jgi:hypothetical protein